MINILWFPFLYRISGWDEEANVGLLRRKTNSSTHPVNLFTLPPATNFIWRAEKVKVKEVQKPRLKLHRNDESLLSKKGHRSHSRCSIFQWSESSRTFSSLHSSRFLLSEAIHQVNPHLFITLSLDPCNFKRDTVCGSWPYYLLTQASWYHLHPPRVLAKGNVWKYLIIFSQEFSHESKF